MRKMELEKMISRKYKYSFYTGLRLCWEQLSLLLLLSSVVVKCNVISLVYIWLVINYITSEMKSKAMMTQCWVIGFIFLVQYWLYLFNMTTASSVQESPIGDYPTVDDLTG